LPKIIVMTSKNIILSVIRTHKPQLATLGVSRIGLFGSYVRNEQQPQSDIDILVDFEPEKETFDNFMNLHYYLEELFILFWMFGMLYATKFPNWKNK